MTLYELTQEERALEEALYENGGELTEELEAWKNQNAKDLSAKLDGYKKIIAEYDALIAATDVEMKKMLEKKVKATNAKKILREHIAFAMKSANLSRLESTGGVKVSRSLARSVEVDEETIFQANGIAEKIGALNLPEYIQLVPKVVKSALDKDNLPEGCTIVESDKITIR